MGELVELFGLGEYVFGDSFGIDVKLCGLRTNAFESRQIGVSSGSGYFYLFKLPFLLRFKEPISMFFTAIHFVLL